MYLYLFIFILNLNASSVVHTAAGNVVAYGGWSVNVQCESCLFVCAIVGRPINVRFQWSVLCACMRACVCFCEKYERNVCKTHFYVQLCLCVRCACHISVNRLPKSVLFELFIFVWSVRKCVCCFYLNRRKINEL